MKHLPLLLATVLAALYPLAAQQPAEVRREPVKLSLVGGDSITGMVSGVKEGNVSVITDYGVIRVPVEPDALLIGGDFNTDDPDTPAAQSPGERTFSFLRKTGFHWTFEGIDHPNRITCPAKGRYPAACFDYFWTRGLGKPLSSVRTAEGSDHLPVVIEISL